MVTRFAWMAQRLQSSNRWTKKSSVAYQRAHTPSQWRYWVTLYASVKEWSLDVTPLAERAGLPLSTGRAPVPQRLCTPSPVWQRASCGLTVPCCAGTCESLAKPQCQGDICAVSFDHQLPLLVIVFYCRLELKLLVPSWLSFLPAGLRQVPFRTRKFLSEGSKSTTRSTDAIPWTALRAPCARCWVRHRPFWVKSEYQGASMAAAIASRAGLYSC
jgi:hypothetical protein